jgi:anti-sigma-K factor RskA
LANAAMVAVTVEPLGGSPTGQPTTTPVYVAPLRASS